MKLPVILIIAMALAWAPIPAAHAVAVGQSTDKPPTLPPRESVNASALEALPDQFPPPPPSSRGMAPSELSPLNGNSKGDVLLSPPNADSGELGTLSLPVDIMPEVRQHRQDAIKINVTPGHKNEVIILDLKKPDYATHILPPPANNDASEPEVLSAPANIMPEVRQHRQDSININVTPGHKKDAIAIKPEKSTAAEGHIRLPGAPPEREQPPVLISMANAHECDEHLNDYLSFWETTVKKQTNLSNVDFNETMKIDHYQIADWNGGSSFRIVYEIRKGWIQTTHEDSFLVKLSVNNDMYNYPALSRGVCLSSDDLKYLQNFEHGINIFGDFSQPLFWENEQTLKSDIIRKIKSDHPNLPLSADDIDCDYRLSSSSTLTCEFIVEIDNSKNQCLVGSAFLLDGSIRLVHNACFYF